MFTGIVTDIGTVTRVSGTPDVRLRIACAYDPATIDIGASIACNGVCLTVVDLGAEGDGAWFDADASSETTSLTTAGAWTPGTRLNLERALRVGDELGGHIVSGHVDGTAEILSTSPTGESTVYRFRAPTHLARFIAPKGSIALDGTSLTVNDVEGAEFTVCIIPHTQSVTTWGNSKAGDTVNIEIDTMARYAARLAEIPA